MHVARATSDDGSFDALWSLFDSIYCLTLCDRPERRAGASAQFAKVGLASRVTFLEHERDVADGKRGCFHAHQHAASLALEKNAAGRTLIFEDDVEFLSHFTSHAASRAAAFLRGARCSKKQSSSAAAGGPGHGGAADDPAADEWEVFFFGHFPRKMELTERPDIVRVRSMDGHAYAVSPAGASALCALKYKGDQVDVAFHYRCERAYALYPMVAVQTPGPSDTEGLLRAEDWNDDKLARERDLYQGCVSRKVLASALGQSVDALARMGALSGPTRAPMRVWRR